MDWAAGRKFVYLFSIGNIVQLKMQDVRPGDVGQLLHLCCIMSKQLPVLFQELIKFVSFLELQDLGFLNHL